MIASPEGVLLVTLTRRGDELAGVAIHSTRPHLADKLLHGHDPGDAAHRIGLIFSLCGRAQRVACEAACAVASGAKPARQEEHERAILLEMAREHAWRLLVDWPEQAGQAPDRDGLARLNQTLVKAPERFAEALEACLNVSLLGEAPQTWLARDLAGFEAWRGRGATRTAALFGGLPETNLSVDCPLLPGLGDLDEASVRELARLALENHGFAARPLWHGNPAETGALARRHATPLLAEWLARHGRGVGARMLARLYELAIIPARLRGAGSGDLLRAWCIAPGTGVAAVETSRGLLLHVARLESGKIADYRIVAPTEWNFHPAGPLFQALAGLPAAGDLAARARLLAQSLDPCVDYQVEVRDEPPAPQASRSTGSSHA